MNILLSACLCGLNCRYDGASKSYPKIDELKAAHNCTLVCPEQLGGLTTPRPSAEQQGQKVVTCDGLDVTEAFRKGAAATLEAARQNGCILAVLKSKSPSCGCGKIYDGNFTGQLTNGNGITAQLLLDNGIRVISEDEIDELLAE